MFDKFQVKFFEEKKEIGKEVSKFGKRVSNLEEYIETSFRVCSKLATAWDSADYSDKQAVQYLAFPDGVLYNGKNDECRTPKINEVFSYFESLQRVSREKEKREMQFELHVPSFVGSTGEMSNQIWDDLEKIYQVAVRLKW